MKMHINLEFHPGFQPPTESGNYYCITTESGMIQLLPFSAKHCRFNTHDCDDTPETAMRVRWWAAVPKAVIVPYGKGMRALGTRTTP